MLRRSKMPQSARTIQRSHRLAGRRDSLTACIIDDGPTVLAHACKLGAEGHARKHCGLAQSGKRHQDYRP
jgi:hypothetical protein